MTTLPTEPLASPAPPPAQPRPPRRALRAATAFVLLPALAGAGGALAVARATGWGEATTTTTIQRTLVPAGPADIQGVLARAEPAVVRITALSASPNVYFPGLSVRSQGTGVIVDARGDVVTNDHVVAGASTITVTPAGSTTTLTATLVRADPEHDLALLHVSAPGPLPFARLASSATVQVGDGVLAVGYALGLDGAPSVTEGIVSGLDRSVGTRTSTGAAVTLTGMVQTDAPISSGNSGGPLLDANGAVVGINTIVATSGQATTAQNIGFAIPADTVRAVLSLGQ